MNYLDEYVSRYILSFLDCDSEIYKVNKFFRNEYKCRKIKMPIIGNYLCKIHGDKDYFYCENVLNKYLYKNDIETIHFDTNKQMEIVKPYLKMLGRVSHFCCNGKGVMFLTDKKINNYNFFLNLSD